MIRLTRINGKEFVLNCEMIKFLEETPDTVVTIVGGEKIMVKESMDDVVRATMTYRKRLLQEPPPKKGE